MTDLQSLSRVGILFILSYVIGFVPFAYSIYGPVSLLFAWWMLPKRYFAIYAGLSLLEMLQTLFNSLLMGGTIFMSIPQSLFVSVPKAPIASPLTPIVIGWSLMPWPLGLICNLVFLVCFMYLMLYLEYRMYKYVYRKTRQLYESVIIRLPQGVLPTRKHKSDALHD